MLKPGDLVQAIAAIFLYRKIDGSWLKDECGTLLRVGPPGLVVATIDLPENTIRESARVALVLCGDTYGWTYSNYLKVTVGDDAETG